MDAPNHMSVESGYRPNPDLIGVISRGLLRLASKGNIILEGLDNIPDVRPMAVVTNHMSVLDALIPYAFLPKTPRTLTKEENLQIPFLGTIIFKNLGAIPVRRGEVDRIALRAGTKVLVDSGILYTCPEGTRGSDVEGNRTVLKPAKAGIIYMTQHAANELKKDIPIIPIVSWDDENVCAVIDDKDIPIRSRLAIHRKQIHIRIGPAYWIYPQIEGQPKKDKQDQVDTIMRQFRDMLPLKYHGYWAKLSPEDS